MLGLVSAEYVEYYCFVLNPVEMIYQIFCHPHSVGLCIELLMRNLNNSYSTGVLAMVFQLQ
jgi:hypothetical protein